MICGYIFADWRAAVDKSRPDPPAAGMPCCVFCGKILKPDEIALTKKLINRGAKDYLCLKCLAGRFDVSEETLLEKIAEFRKMGCTLFN